MNTLVTTIEAMPARHDSHHGCFACGVGNQNGLNLHFDIQPDGVATAIWQPSKTFQSYPDRLHGGVIATILDSAMVHALFSKGVSGVTAELTIRYLRSVGLAEPLLVIGKVESRSHGVYLCRADIHQSGIHSVRATAKFMTMPKEVI